MPKYERNSSSRALSVREVYDLAKDIAALVEGRLNDALPEDLGVQRIILDNDDVAAIEAEIVNAMRRDP